MMAPPKRRHRALGLHEWYQNFNNTKCSRFKRYYIDIKSNLNIIRLSASHFGVGVVAWKKIIKILKKQKHRPFLQHCRSFRGEVLPFLHDFCVFRLFRSWSNRCFSLRVFWLNFSLLVARIHRNVMPLCDCRQLLWSQNWRDLVHVVDAIHC